MFFFLHYLFLVSECLTLHNLIHFSKMELVFVYGTLKRNQPNNYHLNDSKNGCAVFKSTASTIQKYPLVISTKYNIPFLLLKEGIGHVSENP